MQDEPSSGPPEPGTPLSGRVDALARQAALVEFSEDPIIGLTLDGVITDWNPAAERLYGYSAAEAIGTSITRFVPPERRGESEPGLLDKVRAAEVVRQAQTQRMAKDGRRIDVSISMSPIRDEGGRIVGAAAITRDIGARLQAEERVRRSEAQMADAQRIAVVGSWEWEIASDRIDWSNELCRIYGVEAGVDHNFETYLRSVHPDDRARVQSHVEGAFASGAPFSFEHRLIRPDGTERAMLARGELIRGPDGTPIAMRGTGQDITERKRTEAALEATERTLERNLRQQTAVAHLGRQALEGEDLRDLVDQAVVVLQGILERDVSVSILPTADGRCIDVGSRGEDVTCTAIGSADVPFGELCVGRAPALSSDEGQFLRSSANILTDAITRLRAEHDTRQRALHDPLTGLPNRVLFLDRLTVALLQADRLGMVAVLFLDLDRFKLINDSRGHTAGDELLQGIAARLAGVMRPGDTLARFGGDEFCIVCGGLGHEDEAVRIAQRLHAALSLPFSLTTGEHFVSASIGISLAKGGGRLAEDLIREADAAMYRAKDGGRGGLELFDEVMRKNATHRLRMDNDLRWALEGDRDELIALYQPIVSIPEGTVVGVEALARWEHPERGLLVPHEFISVAEESGAIVALGDRVLRLACFQAAAWISTLDGGGTFAVSVNLAPRQVAHPGAAGSRRRDPQGVRPGAREPASGDHRERAHRASPSSRSATCSNSTRSASGSSSTTSAPAIRRSPTCAASRSPRSRSIAASSPDWAAIRTTRRSSRRSCAWPPGCGWRSWRRASRRSPSGTSWRSWDVAWARATSGHGRCPRAAWQHCCTPAAASRSRRDQPRYRG